MLRKKIISALLLIMYVISLVPTVSFAEDVTYYFSDNFDSYVTNEKPSFGTIKGLNSRIYEHKEGSDKAMALQATVSGTQFKYEAPTSLKQFVWTLDINPLKAVPKGTLTLGVSGTTINIANFTSDGRIRAHDGKVIGGISEDSFTTLTFAVDLTNRRCNFYHNGKLVLDNWYLGSSAPKNVTGIVMKFSVGDGEDPIDVLIDNMYIYKGLDILPDNKLPKKAYSSSSVEFKEEVEQVGNAVYLNRTFDEEDAGEFDGLVVQKGSYNKITVQSEKSGNKHLQFDRVDAGGACYIDLNAAVNSPKLFVEFDIMSAPNLMPMYMFFRDADGKDAYVFRVTDEGEFQLYSGSTFIAKLSTAKWTNIGLALNFTEGTMDVYANKKPVISKAVIPSGATGFTFIRLAGSGVIDTTVKFDNLKIYDGLNFREITEEENTTVEVPSAIPTYEEVPGKLSGFVALQLYGGSIFAKGQRTRLDVPAYTKDDRTLVPVRVISEGFDLDVGWDADSKKVTVAPNIEMTVGSKQMKVGNKTVNLEVAPEINNGRTFLPLRAFAEDALGKKVFWDDRGLIVIGDNEFAERGTAVDTINNYMLFDRPEAEKLLELFAQTSANTHPRVMANKETFDRIRRDFASNHPQIKPWCDSLLAYADQLLVVPPHNPDLSSSSFATTTNFLTTARDIQKRIETLSLAYQLTGDKKYVDRVWEEVKKSGSLPHWNNVGSYLSTSHMMASFAVAYDWNYDAWTKDQLTYMEDKMVNNALRLSYNEYRREGHWWPVTNINWNPVCNGSTAMAAAALLDARPEFCADLIENAIRGVEFAVNEFYPEGSWEEGVEYGEYTIQHMVKLLSTLEATFGSDFNLSKVKGFDMSPLDAFYGNGHVAANNYHDAATALIIFDEAFYLADIFDNPGYSEVLINYHESGLEEPTVAGVLFYNTNKPAGGSNLPVDRYFVGTEAGSMRSAWGDAGGTYVGFHGGYSVVNHGHMDNGTFVIDMLGERIIVDTGAAAYDHPDYKNPDKRYNVYKARPEAHNMVVLNPDKTPGIDATAYSPIIKQESKARGAITVMDLTDAYDYTTDYKRAYIMDDDRRSVIVRDEMKLKKASDGYWFMNAASGSEIEIVDNNTAVITYKGKKFLVRIITDAASSELMVMDAVSLPTSPISIDGNAAKNFRKIALKFKASDEVYIAMKIIPYDDLLADREFTNVSIDNWTLPDGEIQTIPRLKSIYIDGIRLEGFNNVETVYTANVPAGKGVPTITADTDANVTYEVTNAADLSGQTVIKAINKSNPELYRYYTIGFRVIDVKVAPIDGYTRHEVYNIFASNEPEAANNALNVFDGSIGTTWSFKGTGQYLWTDLGTPQPINAIAIAAGRGDTRSLYYSIEVSDDCANWKNIYTGATELTNELRIIKVPETTARFVRFVLNGNSTGNVWSALTEFGALYR